MAENLDDESIRNLNETLRELNDQMEQFNRILPNLIVNLDNSGDTVKDQDALMKKLGMTQEQYNKAVEQGIDLKEAERKADEQIARAKAAYNAALQVGVSSIRSFGSALLNAEVGLAKYTDSLDKLGDGALDFGLEMGRGALAVGLLTKGITLLASAGLKQAEAALKARDELVKIGNAGSITARQTLEMGHAAGLTSKNLNLLTKPMQKSSEALATLGGSASQGTAMFKDMVDVGEDTRKSYRRLGLSVGELIENQADYLNLQRLSGTALTAREKTDGSLQKASLKYTENLLTLANITGKNVDQIKKEQEAAAANYQVQLKNLELNKRIRDAEAAGNTQLADQLKKERDARNEFIQGLASTTDPQTLAAMQEYLVTGVITERTAPLLQLGIPIEQFAKRLKQGEDSGKLLAEFQTQYARGIENNATRLQTAAAINEETGRQFGITTEGMQQTNRIMNQNQQDLLQSTRDNIAKGKQAGTDAAADVAAQMESTERLFQQAVDKFVLSVNPLFKSFELTTAAAIALGSAAALAAAALVRLASQAGILGLPKPISQPGQTTPPGGPTTPKPSGPGQTTPPGGPTTPKPGGIRPAVGVGLAGAGIGLAGAAASQALGPETTGGKVASTLGYAGQGAALGAMFGPWGAAIGGAAGLAYGGYQALTTPTAEKTADQTKQSALQREMAEASERNKQVQEATAAATRANTQELAKTGKNLQNLSATVATNTETTKEQTTQLLAGRNVGEGIMMSSEQLEADAARQQGVAPPTPAPTPSPTTEPKTVTAKEAGLATGPVSRQEFFDQNRFEEKAGARGTKVKIKLTDEALTQKYEQYVKDYEKSAEATFARLVDKDIAADKQGLTLYKEAKDALLDKQVFTKEKLIELYNQAAIREDTRIAKDIEDALRERKDIDAETRKQLTEINKKAKEYNKLIKPVVMAEDKKRKDAEERAAKSKEAVENKAKARYFATGSAAPGAGELSTSGPQTRGGGRGGRSQTSARGSRAGESASSAGGDTAGTQIAGNVDASGVKSPSERKILDFIGQIEGRGNYNILVGGKTQTDPALVDMSVSDVLDFQKSMLRSGFESSAVGKYQIINKTLAGLVNRGVLSPNQKFDESAQDKAALALMDARGYSRYKSGGIDVNTIANNLAKEWASLPMPDGRSYYEGTGSNKSLVSRNEYVSALQAKKGGIVSGPESGFPAVLHGQELISPLTPNSILEKLAQTPAQSVKSINEALTSTFNSTMGNAPDKSLQDISRINYDMMNMLSEKLDNMIDKLGDSNNIQEKILRQTTS